MRSCLSLLFVLLVMVAVTGGGALICYLSASAEFSRKDGTPAASRASQ